MLDNNLFSAVTMMLQCHANVISETNGRCCCFVATCLYFCRLNVPSDIRRKCGEMMEARPFTHRKDSNSRPRCLWPITSSSPTEYIRKGGIWPFCTRKNYFWHWTKAILSNKRPGSRCKCYCWGVLHTILSLSQTDLRRPTEQYLTFMHSLFKNVHFKWVIFRTSRKWCVSYKKY